MMFSFQYFPLCEYEFYTVLLHVICVCRVQCYIEYGWDQYLVDPDKGANSRRKLAAVHTSQSLASRLLSSVPAEDDPQWTNRLYKIPKITFSTMYDFLVDRKVMLRQVSYPECNADKWAEEVTKGSKADS